jgi:hypothetical protein
VIAKRDQDKNDQQHKKDQNMQTSQTAGNGNYGTNYAVFEWDGSNWQVAENCCDYGCVPTPPSAPGSYPGQTTVTTCEPRFERMPLPPTSDS